MEMSKIAARNRERMLEQMDDGLLLMKAPPELYRNSDINYSFRQHSNMYYLTGISEPGIILALQKKGRRSRYILFVYPFDKKQAIWNGSRVSRKEAREQHGVGSARLLGDFERELPELLAGHSRLYLDFQEGSGFSAEMLRKLGSLSSRNREGINYPGRLIDAAAILSELRLRKEEPEIELMQKAADITCAAYRKGLSLLKPGMMEYELQSVLEQEFSKRGGNWAYGSIVAGGENGLVLHYISNREQLRDGELVLIDAGAEYSNYACDVSRTWPVNGRFTPAQKQVYQAVLKAQLAAIEVIKPGATYQEIDRVATRILVEELIKMKALKGKPADIIRRKSHVAFYPHGTGHWLGLDTHDAGQIKPDGKERVLEPGMVLTVEPGLYFQPDRRQTPPRLRGIAVRIEDDVLVTEDGYRVLTAAIPKEVAEIEQICARKKKKSRK